MLSDSLKIAIVIGLGFISIANADEQRRIGLQNAYTREVVYCYDNPQSTAEDCASYFESQGFVKMQYIPYKMAKYDFLTVETFPTRRWRNNELTPRW